MANKVMCPGQDTRFWKSDDIFNVKCGNCGNMLEFFKDDASRKCSNCGVRVKNPKLSIGCAQWCEHAKECLGYDPKEDAKVDEYSTIDESLAEKIKEAVKSELGENSPEFKNSIKALESTKNLLKLEGGDPLVIIAATLFYNVYIKVLQNDGKDCTQTKNIMKSAGLDNNTIDEVCEIMDNLHMGMPMKSDEYKIIEKSLLKNNF